MTRLKPYISHEGRFQKCENQVATHAIDFFGALTLSTVDPLDSAALNSYISLASHFAHYCLLVKKIRSSLCHSTLLAMYWTSPPPLLHSPF